MIGHPDPMPDKVRPYRKCVISHGPLKGREGELLDRFGGYCVVAIDGERLQIAREELILKEDIDALERDYTRILESYNARKALWDNAE